MGVDLTGAFGGTGGVGALLQITDHVAAQNYYVAYDHNGNVIALERDDGNLAAGYEYSTFGEPMRADVQDSVVFDNPFRFSTKYTDQETGLVYYGNRYYGSREGRFINRDPIQESGGLNLYGFAGNNAVSQWDVLGLTTICYDEIINGVKIPICVTDDGQIPYGASLLGWGSNYGLDSTGTQLVRGGSNSGATTVNTVLNAASSASTNRGSHIETLPDGSQILVFDPLSVTPRYSDSDSLQRRDSMGADGPLPTLTQRQIDQIWGAWSKYVKLDANPSNQILLKTVLAQAALFRRPNGKAAIAMRQGIEKLLAPGHEDLTILLSIGQGNMTDPPNPYGYVRIALQLDNMAQMVVSFMHEFLHATDYMTWRYGLDSMLPGSNARHEEIYQLQNQTLWDITGTLDHPTVQGADKYVGPTY